MEIRYWKRNMRCETEDFRDGHRGVGLLLKNKNIFMNVKIYYDIVMPDFE